MSTKESSKLMKPFEKKMENTQEENKGESSPSQELSRDNNSRKKNALLRKNAILLTAEKVTRRKAFAAKDLGEGELVFTEKALVWVVRAIVTSEICHCCQKDIKTSMTYVCPICNSAYYCSKKCEAESKELHKLECNVSIGDKLSKISKQTQVHLDILRIFVRTVCQR